MKCDNCNINMKKKRVDYNFLGFNLGKFEAFVCERCNEQLFDEAISTKIDKAAKDKGLWGLQSTTKIGRTGDSFDVRINKKLATLLKLKKGQEVRIYPEGSEKIVISL